MSDGIKESLAKKSILLPVGIILTIIVYSILGIYFNTSFVKIYDEFPEEFYVYPSDSEKVLTYNIRNNSPYTLPLINPFYITYVWVNTTENQDVFAFFSGSGSKPCNFTDYSCDLGLINSGDSREFSFSLCPTEGNFTFRTIVKLSFGSFKPVAASSTYSVEYIGNNNYLITKVE